MEAPERESWLLHHVADLGFNAIWFSPMSVTSAVEKHAHGQKQTGSYYAIRDHFSLDPEFSSGSPERDSAHLKHFCHEAQKNGIRVFADLVFNHVAIDHALVQQEEREINDIKNVAGRNFECIYGHKNKLIGLSYEDQGQKKAFYFKFRRNDDLSLLIGGPAEDPWSDVAQVNYSSPAARKFFVEDDNALFKKVIDWHLDHGFTGFRCDAAYKIPPEAWQELIGYAKSKNPDTVFLAETLCHDQHKVERLSNAKIDGKPAFDLGMLGHYWWNFEDSWLPREEAPRIQGMSRYGGAGAPDNHDTQDTLAGNFRKAFNYGARADEAIAEICIRNYAVSTLTANSVYMQMGYEFCNEKQNHVFKGMVTPEDWQKLAQKRSKDGCVLNISARIREINEIKEKMGVEHCLVSIKATQPLENGKLVSLHCVYTDAETGQKKGDIVLTLNKKPEHGPVSLNGQEIRDVSISITPAPEKIRPAASLKAAGRKR